jgi:hypothetical protein
MSNFERMFRRKGNIKSNFSRRHDGASKKATDKALIAGLLPTTRQVLRAGSRRKAS